MRGQAVVNRAPASRRISALRASILHAFGCASLRAPLASVAQRFRCLLNLAAGSKRHQRFRLRRTYTYQDIIQGMVVALFEGAVSALARKQSFYVAASRTERRTEAGWVLDVNQFSKRKLTYTNLNEFVVDLPKLHSHRRKAPIHVFNRIT